ncbi:MAG: hypothetical protein R3321_09360, partial [Nitrososphaeraceae archaeon]|nr:hypothetical protein [Nitrososphaeraceae archaeon]
VNDTEPLNKTQEWINERDNVKILFTYQPERPIIDTFTKLEFSVINLTSNENLKDFDARVVVTLPSGQRLFRFENITVPDGDFSVDYIFPDDGTHQVLTRIDKESSVRVLASFNVFVPHQAPPSILNPFPTSPGSELSDNPSLLLSMILAIIAPIIGGILVLIIILKMGKNKIKKSY